MTEGEAAAVLQDHLNKSIDAKLMPIVGLVFGLGFAVVHLFNLLDQKHLLSKQEALASLAATRESLPPSAPSAVVTVLRHLETIPSLQPAQPEGALPEALRTLFEALQPDPTKKPN